MMGATLFKASHCRCSEADYDLEGCSLSQVMPLVPAGNTDSAADYVDYFKLAQYWDGAVTSKTWLL